MYGSNSTENSTVKSGGHRQAPDQSSNSSAVPGAPIVSERSLPDDVLLPIISLALPLPNASETAVTTGKAQVWYVKTISLVSRQCLNWVKSMMHSLEWSGRFRPYDSQVSAAARRLLNTKPDENSDQKIAAALQRLVQNSVTIELSELGGTLAKAFLESTFQTFSFMRLEVRFSGAFPYNEENLGLLSGFLRRHADRLNRPPVTITMFGGVNCDISGLAKDLKAYGKGEMKLTIFLDGQDKLEWLDRVVESQAVVSSWTISVGVGIDDDSLPSLGKALFSTEGLRSLSLSFPQGLELKDIFSNMSQASTLDSLLLYIGADAATDLSGLPALIASLPKLAFLRLRITGDFPLEPLKQALEQTQLNHPALKTIEYLK